MAIKVKSDKSTFERGGTYLKEPGTYHCIVMETNEQPSTKAGALIDGFQVKFAALAGTTSGQEKKEIELIFWNAKLTDTEKQQAMSEKKQNRFLEAVGLLDRHQEGELEIELNQAVGRQCVMTLVYKQKKNEKGEYVDDTTGLQLSYADIFHIDDPEAASFPKNEKAIARLPAELRRKPEYFGKSDSKPANKKPPATNTAELLADL